jgi:rhodanese-related sulfurtransferase
MKYAILSLLTLFLNLSCAQTDSMPIKQLTSSDLEDAVLVDVRTPEEFQEGHLENALNINWFDDDFAEQFKDLDKRKTIYVYCKVGGRSAKAQERLKALGFKSVVNLTGGYDAYKQQNGEN